MGRAPGEAAKDQAPVSAPEPRRSFVTLPLAQLVPGITRSAFRKRSPAGATLMADWLAVVGPALAAVTEPRRLTRGQLTIACAGPVAMELQHAQASLIDRINSHAGQALVERLRFVQDHVAARPALRRRRHVPVAPVPGIAEGPLQDALAGLLQAIRQGKEGVPF